MTTDTMITREELREELVRWEESLDARIQEIRVEMADLRTTLEGVVRHLQAYERDPSQESMPF